MPLPHSLNEFLSPARSSITSAIWLDAELKTGNACVMLDSTRQYVEASADTEDAFVRAKRSILVLKALAAHGPIVSERDKAEFEDARREALYELDQLEAVLEGTKANALGRAMGMAWDDGSWC